MADISKIAILDGTTYDIKDTIARRAHQPDPIETKTYTNVIATANDQNGAGFFYLKVRGDTYNSNWHVKTRVKASVPGQINYYTDTTFDIFGFAGTYSWYACLNRIRSTSYRPIYYNCLFLANETGYNNGCGNWIGFNLMSSANPTNSGYKREITVELLEYENCTVELQDTLITPTNIPERSAHTNYYNSTNTSYTNFDALNYGLKQSGDNNTTSISNLYFASGNYIAHSAIYRYELLFQMDENTFTPLNNVNTGYDSTSKAMLTNIEFNPFGRILYYATTTAAVANGNIEGGALYYSYNGVDLRYTFNCGTTLTAHKPLYLVVTPTSNGKCKIANSTPWTQTLPTTNDEKWYILLGRTYSTYQLSLYPYHPVYYHDGTSIKEILVTDIIGNATTVNGHTVNADVPSGAKFTDTTYTPASAAPLMDGTATVGTSEKYAREDHKHPSDTTKLNKTAELLTTNPFAPESLKGPYISKIDNAFYAADKRWIVTMKDSVSGTSFGTLANLFDGDYESQLPIDLGKTGILTIDFSTQSSGYFPGYPYGYILVSFYYDNAPASVSGRVYCNYESQGIGWHDIAFSPLNGNTSTQIVYRSDHQSYYNISKLEITIVGSSTNRAGLSQVEMHLDRPNSKRTPFLSKYAAETLYYDLTAPNFNGKINNHTVNSDVPANAVFTDTTYESKAAASGGTALSLVTTGEKYTWNNKGSYSKPSSGIPKTDLASAVQTSLGKADSALQSHQTIKQDGVTGATVNRFGTCSTAAGTAAKTVDITTGTFTLEAGARVTVKFTNANTANTPTLNVNSKGAKNIFHKGAQITNGGNKALLAGTVDFVYDGTQWHLIGNYIDTTNAGTITGITMNGTSKGTSGVVNLGTVITAHQDISGKADKTATVSTVTYDSTNKKITKTINGTTSDIVTASTLKSAMALDNVENKSSATIRGELTKANVTTALGYTPPTTNTTYTASTSKLVTTTVPNITSVGSATKLGTAISATNITAWTSNTPTQFVVTGEKLSITTGSAATLSYDSKTIPNVTSAGTAPTLGTAITVATGSLAANGSGSTVVTGITGS